MSTDSEALIQLKREEKKYYERQKDNCLKQTKQQFCSPSISLVTSKLLKQITRDAPMLTHRIKEQPDARPFELRIMG